MSDIFWEYPRGTIVQLHQRLVRIEAGGGACIAYTPLSWRAERWHWLRVLFGRAPWPPVFGARP